MTNLDSILKRRNITSLTNAHIVKAMVFPLVMYGCESWIIEKVLEKTLENPLDSKEIKPSILKEISPEYTLEGLMLKLKLQYFDHLT